MIERDTMMTVLLDACPSFEPKWQAFLNEWQGAPGGLPLYLALGDFARHLIEMLERGETDRVLSIFEALERLHIEGDHYVREAATVGLLEALQNLNLTRTTDPEQFRQFLGPESTRWWNKLIRFWEHGEPLNEN